MPLYVLDTDAFSLLREGHSGLARRVAATDRAHLATTVITVEENLAGWFSLLRKSRTRDRTVFAYQELAASVRFFSRTAILDFTPGAIERFEELRALRLNIGAMDLRIAAIVLETAAVLITRNVRDFSRVPGLVFEDWTKPDAGPDDGEARDGSPPAS